MKDINFFGMGINGLVPCSLVLGALVIIAGFILSRRKSTALKHAECKVDETKNLSASLTSEKSENSKSGAVGGKRGKNKKRREAQEFTHSWMVGALKGHTGSVLDMKFSSDGKFLASCAEDCGSAPEEDLEEEGISDHRGLSSSANSKDVTKASGDSSKPDDNNQASSNREILSRRQRKNRTRAMREQRRDRDDENDDETSGTLTVPTPSVSRHHRHHHRQQNDHHRQRYFHTSPASSTDSSSAASTPRALNSRRNFLNQNNNNKSVRNNQNKSMNNSINSRLPKKNEKQTANIITKNDNNRLSNTLDFNNNSTLSILFRQYMLNGTDLVRLGYPVECSCYPGHAVILKHQHPVGHNLSARHQNKNIYKVSYNQQLYKQFELQQQPQQQLDVNAREFIPSNSMSSSGESESDSGHASASSSVENSDLDQGSSSDSDKGSDIVESLSISSDYLNKERRDSQSGPVTWGNPDPSLSQAVERPCVRCSKQFSINRETFEYITKEECFYHWGKKRNVHSCAISMWDCCHNEENSPGCTQGSMHVWSGLTPGCNGPFEGYVRTKPTSVIACDGDYGIYALDCEMCFTKSGLELVKVTVVDMRKKIVYDTLVKPDTDIIDYNTRFSGITENMLNGVEKTLRDVQNDLMSFIKAETILIGHGLENDLKALKLLHSTIIDTCIIFPHFLGYPYRYSLKTLARNFLNKEIQTNEHDSVEDAKIVVDLMLKRVKYDYQNKLSSRSSKTIRN